MRSRSGLGHQWRKRRGLPPVGTGRRRPWWYDAALAAWPPLTDVAVTGAVIAGAHVIPLSPAEFASQWAEAAQAATPEQAAAFSRHAVFVHEFPTKPMPATD